MKRTKTDAEWFRKYVPGCLGGEEVAQEMTTNELIFVLDLDDKATEAYNTYVEYQRMGKNTIEAIRERV
jgi:hypothetical protein